MQWLILTNIFQKWAEVDPVFENIAVKFPGVRILKQDPVENLFSFICSSNNNIQRISGMYSCKFLFETFEIYIYGFFSDLIIIHFCFSGMVEKLSTHYGKHICTIDGKKYHCFPTIENLSNEKVENQLRKLGFGYRAGYIFKSAKQLQEMGGKDFLLGLRKKSYEEARTQLLNLSGIGPKVADCVLLMSLDKPEVRLF